MTSFPEDLMYNALHVQDDEQTVVVEPYVEAMEVSVCVLETAAGPVALLPTEIELFDMDHAIMDGDLDLQHHIDRNEVYSCCVTNAIRLTGLAWAARHAC